MARKSVSVRRRRRGGGKRGAGRVRRKRSVRRVRRTLRRRGGVQANSPLKSDSGKTQHTSKTEVYCFYYREGDDLRDVTHTLLKKNGIFELRLGKHIFKTSDKYAKRKPYCGDVPPTPPILKKEYVELGWEIDIDDNNGYPYFYMRRGIERKDFDESEHIQSE